MRKGLLIAIGCAFVLSACSSKTPEAAPAAPEASDKVVATEKTVSEEISNPEVKEDPVEPEVVEEPVSDESQPDAPDDSVSEAESSTPTLADMETYLSDQGVLTGTRVQKAGELIGAVEGVGYDNCEIYLFDTDSDAYKKASNGEELFVEGMESFGGFKFDAVNGPYALLLKGGSSDLVDAFNSYK